MQVGDDFWRTFHRLPRVGFLTTEKNFFPAMCFLTPAYPVWVSHGLGPASAVYRLMWVGGGHYTVLWSNDQEILCVQSFAMPAASDADVAAGIRPRSNSMETHPGIGWCG